jgi:hypothetical protein
MAGNMENKHDCEDCNLGKGKNTDEIEPNSCLELLLPIGGPLC